MFRQQLCSALVAVTAAAFVLLSGLLFAGAAGAAQFKDLDAQALKSKLDGGEQLVLINPLSDIEFNQAHIPGSVNIPVHKVAGSDLLPADKATPIVTYCLGPK